MSADDDHNRPRLLAMDTGGTMTDTFVVDDEANYTVGKAQTTPDDESVCTTNSFADAVDNWGLDPTDGAGELEGIVYSGTAMLNRLLEREGSGNIGVITNGGMEDQLRFGRGIQSWADRSYAGRLHAREHEHPEPLVPRENIRGVRGRMNMTGLPTLPLYEDEAYDAIHDLLDRGVRVICVCLVYSYLNDNHEQKIKEIAEEVMEKRGESVPIWLSSEQKPIRGELPRLNTLVIEAYAAEPSREQLRQVDDGFTELGSESPVRVLTSSGGTVAPEHDWLVDTMLSGPIGGIFGGEFLAEELDIDNLVCSDVGGTSFDVGLITEGHYPTRWDQSLAQFMVNIPMTAMDTIGSGTGSYVRVDRTSERIEVGPDSAGYKVGYSNMDSDVDTVTVTDCTLALGYLNPDSFLGGDIPMDREVAIDAIDDQIASPLDEDPIETARGVLDIVERDMSNELRGLILGLGYSPENYTLMSYGGGGPLHAAGYSRGLEFEDILIPQWAAAFSAFGCACADSAYRYDQSVDEILQPDFSNASSVAYSINDTLETLRKRAETAFDRDGVDPETVEFQPSLRIQYLGMLDDLEVDIGEVWDDEEGIDSEGVEDVIDRYEAKFDQVFQRAAKSPENGYQITMAIGVGVGPSAKPTIPHEELRGETPPEDAHKGTRDIYWDDAWHAADLWQMRDIQPGNRIEGPSVIEAPATTILVPPGYEAPLDENRIYHLQEQ
ncbi:hydantoinase/oxoprolinase family protein [Natronomonas gomsonensis]|uniref:hydantoinase/oxoprolinase family protein n=1 Tax=Natronomonas gomsonensis TaxID=1046043 RepID=UPI0020CA5443|nr:hydantoinase/oxoprolinase family protein [Natronomonas gomsonensis]MCY4729675.1 hydantoinase/oxoprolinase family protein [Natronomonas gomsonensis]